MKINKQDSLIEEWENKTYNNIECDIKLKASIFFIEANSFEILQLWKEFKEYWVEDNVGFYKTIGFINNDKNMPINVLFNFTKLFNQQICFYNVISRFNDSELVENFLEKNYPVKYEGRRAMTNAMNFHNVSNYCEKLNNERFKYYIKA